MYWSLGEKDLSDIKVMGSDTVSEVLFEIRKLRINTVWITFSKICEALDRQYLPTDDVKKPIASGRYCRFPDTFNLKT